MSSLMSRRRQPTDPAQRAGADEETVQLERTLFQRRRRSRRFGRLRQLVAIALAVLVVAVGGYVVWFSGLLSAQQVQVTGTSYVAPVQVREAARVRLGEPLARVDLSGVRARVSRLPAVRSVRVSRAWPHTVRVEVTERVAVAVIPQGNGFRGLSADGVLFRGYGARPAGLPEVRARANAGEDALRESARVVGSLPPGLLRRVAHVSVATIDQITLVMRGGRLVTWGNSSQSAQKAEVLAVLMKRPSSQIDVSVPGRPTTRP